MDDLTDKVRDKAKKDLARLTDPIMDDLLNVDKVKMPEEVFKGRYLDSFANGGNPEAVKEFASVAGGYHNEVDVVDSKGNVIFTTPPMVSSPDFSNIDEIKETDFSGIGKETQTKMNTGHINPTKEFNDTLSGMEKKMLLLAEQANKENQDKWSLIFNRYSAVKSTIGIAPKEEVEFNYDD